MASGASAPVTVSTENADGFVNLSRAGPPSVLLSYEGENSSNGNSDVGLDHRGGRVPSAVAATRSKRSLRIRGWKQENASGELSCRVYANGDGSLEILRTTSSDVRLTISTMATALKSGTPGSALVFHRYGNRYFLSQIRTGDGHAREVFPSQQEKELARSESIVEVALLGPAPAGKP